jgi:transitional endoplasmic reticulum ATPase
MSKRSELTMSTKSKFKAYLLEKLENAYLRLFCVLPGFLLLFASFRLFGLWIYAALKLKPLSFSIGTQGHSGMNDETMIVLAAIGYLLFLNLSRFLAALYTLRSSGSVSTPPPLTSHTLEIISTIVLVMFGAFFALWLWIGDKSGTSNYWLIGCLGVLTAFSWFISKFEWCYGLKPAGPTPGSRTPFVQSPAEQTRVVYGGGEQDRLQLNVARVERPRITFADILGNKDVKRRLLDASRVITAPRRGACRNGILLHGDPGNGKTVFAEALAGELRLPILKLTHSDVASRWVGERTEKIKAAFDQAIESQPCVFLIDEIDSFIPERSGASSQAKEDSDVVNSLLTLLVDIREHKVVVVAATNHMDRLDGAAVREGRFDFKVEITPPDEEARVGLLTSGLGKNLYKVAADPQTIQSVAKRWNGFSVKRILAVTEELPSYIAELRAAGTWKKTLEYEDFMAALRRIQGRRGANPENVKPMSDLVLSDVTKEALEMLSGRLRDPQRVERLGGTLPTGVLFYGPPGTGKTAACKALAREVNWAFLIATGTDLARDPKELDKLFAQAKELRPCIVFVDEADELLRARESSNSTEATNKLLTLMDGVRDRVRDVVWIAATNHPEQIDQALLRGGRFTEKLEFVRPDVDQLVSHLVRWLQARGIALASDVSAQEVAQVLGGESIANLEAVLQYAVNRAISKSTGGASLVLTANDIQMAAKTVLAFDV